MRPAIQAIIKLVRRKAAFSAEQASVVHPDVVDFSSKDNVQRSVANSESSAFQGAHAAGSLGFGAYFQGRWFAGIWDKSQVYQSIAYNELFPIVIAPRLWRLGMEQRACVISLRQRCGDSYSQF